MTLDSHLEKRLAETMDELRDELYEAMEEAMDDLRGEFNMIKPNCEYEDLRSDVRDELNHLNGRMIKLKADTNKAILEAVAQCKSLYQRGVTPDCHENGHEALSKSIANLYTRICAIENENRYLNNIKSNLDRHGESWCNHEDDKLMQELDTALNTIASNHHRSVTAIKCRIKQKGLV